MWICVWILGGKPQEEALFLWERSMEEARGTEMSWRLLSLGRRLLQPHDNAHALRQDIQRKTITNKDLVKKTYPLLLLLFHKQQHSPQTVTPVSARQRQQALSPSHTHTRARTSVRTVSKSMLTPATLPGRESPSVCVAYMKSVRDESNDSECCIHTGRTHTNTWLWPYYTGAKSLFGFIFLEIWHWSQSCPQHSCTCVHPTAFGALPDSETISETHNRPTETEEWQRWNLIVSVSFSSSHSAFWLLNHSIHLFCSVSFISCFLCVHFDEFLFS